MGERFVNRLFAVLAFSLMVSGFANHASAVVLYDIDFNSDTVGSTPTVDGSSSTISSINFGSPEVVDRIGRSYYQPLLFNTTGNTSPFYYDQIGLNLGNGFNHYTLDFQIYTEFLKGSVNNFAVFFDTPQVRRLDFANNGQVMSFTQDGSQFHGNYLEGINLNVSVDIDLLNNMWSFNVHNIVSYTGAFTSIGGDLNSIRFSLGNLSSNTGMFGLTNVAIDNILVTGENISLPEPGTLALLAMGLVPLVLARRRSLKK